MKTYRLVLTETADRDLQDLLAFTDITFGPQQRVVYRDKIHKAFKRLQSMPNIGHLRKDIPKEMKSYTVGQHSIIYRMNESQQEIFIYRILHVRMDFTDKV